MSFCLNNWISSTSCVKNLIKLTFPADSCYWWRGENWHENFLIASTIWADNEITTAIPRWCLCSLNAPSRWWVDFNQSRIKIRSLKHMPSLKRTAIKNNTILIIIHPVKSPPCLHLLFTHLLWVENPFVFWKCQPNLWPAGASKLEKDTSESSSVNLDENLLKSWKVCGRFSLGHQPDEPAKEAEI